MKSLSEKLESAARRPVPAGVSGVGVENTRPMPLAPARWDWRKVRRVLVVRLRSIGDTVLATASLYALRRFLPHARIDILLEDWVAPVLDGNKDVDGVITVERRSLSSRVGVSRKLRAARYDVAYNLHGGTTATLLVAATGAKYRVGYTGYQYAHLHNHRAPPSTELWGRNETHSLEQQLALIGWTGVPVSDCPPPRLAVTEEAAEKIAIRLRAAQIYEGTQFALVHPAAAFESKQWATINFARVTEELRSRGLEVVALAAPHEAPVVADLINNSSAPITAFTDLSLPEVVALASRARLFVGNDSGIAHIAAAVRAPSVVIFGSSNVAHWRPWATTAPAEVVREEMPCAPCPGYTCAEFDKPECIRRVSVEHVTAAIARVLEKSVRREAFGRQPASGNGPGS